LFISKSETVGVRERKMTYVGLAPGMGHWVPEGLLRGAYRLKLVT
jgi:hypothetical protein